MNNFSTPIISNRLHNNNNNDTSLTFSEELGLNTSNNSGYIPTTTPVATLRGGGDINNNMMSSEQRSKSQPKSGRLINVNTPFKGRTGRVEQSQSQPSYNKIRSRSKSRSKSTGKQRQPVTQNLSSTKEKFVSKLSVLHRKKKYAVSNSADNNIKLSNGNDFNIAIAEARSQIREGNTVNSNYVGYDNQMRGRDNNVCDYCQSISHGKIRSEMYARLEYVYCSTQCTRSHQVRLLYVEV